MKVTVLIPTFNYANYILYALKSIENQTYPLHLIEIIIIDDGSTDHTEDTISNYPSKVQTVYHYQQNRGKANATQKGIDLAKGEIVFNLDADDYFESTKIEKVVNIFEQNPTVTHVGHPASIFYEKNNAFESEHIPKEICGKVLEGTKVILYFLKKRMLFGGGSTYATRTHILKNNLIPRDIDMYIDEYLIFCSLSFGDCFLINEKLSVWRVHTNNYSVSKNTDYIEKQNRLIHSSNHMNNYVKLNPVFTRRIKDIYFIKHLDRLVGFKTEINKMLWKDKLELLAVIFSLKYSISTLHNYRILYRLLPHNVINGGKKLISIFKKNSTD